MAWLLTGCKVYDPLYCDEDRRCIDPDRPYCDLRGEFPGSEGVGRTCIADPFGDEIDGGVTPADAAVQDLDASASADGGAACRWTQLVRLAGINSTEASEYVGSLNEAGTVVYFDRAGSADIDGFFTASRPPGQAFGDMTPLVGLSADETFRSDPEVSSTGLEILFFTTEGLAAARRSSAELPFEPAEAIGIQGGSPSLSGDGLSLYYVNEGDVFRATRTEVGQPWSEGERILPTTGFGLVDVSPDERRLLLLANPFELPSMPLLIAERSSPNESFGAPVPMDQSILVEGVTFYSAAAWNGSDEMIVSFQLDGEVDMFYAACQ